MLINSLGSEILNLCVLPTTFKIKYYGTLTRLCEDEISSATLNRQPYTVYENIE